MRNPWQYHGDGIMSRIRAKDGKEVFYLRFWYDGREIKEQTGVGKSGHEKAVKLRELRRMQIEEGSFKPPAVRVKERGQTFRQFVTKRFLDEHQSRGGTTYYRDVLIGRSEKPGREETPILKFFGDRLMHEITRSDLDKFRALRSKQVGPSTVRKNLMVLGTIFRKAVEWGAIRHSPAAMMSKPSEPKHKIRFLSRDEWTTLRAAAAAYQGGWVLPIVTFAVFTGMRLKEIVGLTWGDVNWKTDMLELSNDNKTASPRSVPMNRTVRTLLERDLAGRFKPRTAPVFTGPEGEALTGLKERNRLSQRVKDVCRAAGLTDCSMHTLRHTAASWMVQAGVPLAEVRGVLGHANMQTTLRYAHLQPGHLRAAVDALDAAQ